MASIAEIRAKLLAQQAKSENKNTGNGDRAMYPFWNTPEGQSSTIRFLPDADPSNVYFWVERLVIKLPFQGIKGESDRETLVQVPCMEMYGETCPILAETRPWWKDDSLVDLARKYWKKKSYLFNGFVVNSGFTEENGPPENPVRRFAINTSIFDIIKSSLMNPEMEDLPTDYVSGRDFKLTKTKKGEYANYSTSNWSFKTRSLTSAEQESVEKFGLNNLKDFLPKKPTTEELNVIKEMFQASVEDEPYDPARWSNFYKPYGSATTAAVSAPTAKAVSKFTASTIPDDVEEAEKAFTSPAQSSASDALDKLKSRSTESASSNKTASKDPMEILRKIKERQNAG